MKNSIVLAVLVVLSPALRADVKAPDTVSLRDYLGQVRVANPQARALSENVRALQMKLGEADGLTAPEIYGEAGVSDDQSEKLVPFMGTRTEGHGWKLGLRKQFTTGTMADLYYDSRFANITGASGIPQPNYWENKATLELSQPLWRNGFGSKIRADMDLTRAESRKKLWKARYDLNNLLLESENTYWSLVFFNQVIRLQEENVDRSKKLRDIMRNKAGLRLVDDVDYLQAQASLETRELELQSSQDERSRLVRQFNTFRGSAREDVEALNEIPDKDWTAKFKAPPKVSREDFAALKEEAEAAAAATRSARSQLRPQLDLVGSFSANGMNPRSSEAYQEVQDTDHGSWMVGVRFSASLDMGLTRDLMHAYQAQQRAAREAGAFAEFSLERTYAQLVEQHGEAQRRLEKATTLEQLQTELVKRERRRLLNGRTTTFQAINMEQNLASAQIQKVQAQLALVKVHNILKTFAAGEQ